MMDNQKGIDYLAADGSRLRVRTLRAAKFGAVSQAIGVGLGLVSVVILSRLVSPDAFGLFGMAAVGLGVLTSFTDSGLSFAAEQQDDVSQTQMSNLFWANTALGAASLAIAMLAAPVAAWAFGRDEILALTAALGVNLLIASLSVQHAALLRRQLHFGREAIMIVASRVLALAAAIGAARLGWGCWALVAQELTGTCARVALAWGLCSWRPSLPTRGSGSMPLLRLGASRSMAEVLGALRRQADSFVIGWLFGPEALGLYSRASALLAQPMFNAIHPLTRVAIPSLSRVQRDPDRFSSAVSEGLAALALVTLPACGLVAVSAEPIVMVALGTGWEGAIPMMRALSLGMFATCLFWPPLGWGFSALGRTHSQARWAAFALVCVIAACAVGSRFGATGVAWAVSAALWVAYPIGTHMALRDSGVRLLDLASAVVVPGVATMIACTATMITLTATLGRLEAAPSLLAAVTCFAVAYFGALMCTGAGRGRLRHVLRLSIGR